MTKALSGVALVEAVTARLTGTKRKPLAAKTLEALDVSPSLRAWLAFDVSSPAGGVSLVSKSRLAVRTAMDLFEELVVSESEGEEWEDDTRTAMRELADTLPGGVLLLREPCGQDHFLYLGKRDSRGEHPVIGLEDEQLFIVEPGFDFYVASFVDGVPIDEKIKKRARAEMEGVIA
jgi:hypothetical protein